MQRIAARHAVAARAAGDAAGSLDRDVRAADAGPARAAGPGQAGNYSTGGGGGGSGGNGIVLTG
ncbi:hypothetical protein ACCC88_19160, partial [Sphingomonas sp. Sphisp140]|uniref:hypothetical protein n=1 Tax=Sphingomonas sp. Sphisp140 TaxID=3243019 RepID=UPI0039AEEDC5